MTVYRMDHAGVVVGDPAAAVAFFVELGLELEGEATVQVEWIDQLVGLDGVRADIGVVRTPEGPGIPRLTFVVDEVDVVLSRLRAHGAELVGEVAQYGSRIRP
jgi:catechol 2,3-dioxygenase-like lactoylglutathione lyase family enzyme